MSLEEENEITVSRHTNDLEESPIIIAIGASAGGLEALKDFFAHVPSHSQYSFVVIQHLSPDHKSLMDELLAKITTIPIHVVEQNMEVERGAIYLIPPKKNMTLLNGKLRLEDKPTNKQLNLPIDIFFRSLAKEYKEKAICVILSGTGSDGTSGARALKEVGGMVMVQDPLQAKFDGMPNSVINTGLVDYTMPADELPIELIHFIDHPKSNGSLEHKIEQDKETINQIINRIKDTTNLDFSYYKRPTLVRRIARRISVNKLDNQKEYVKLLFESSDEANILSREFLIGVTNFFRDSFVWEKLEKEIIPALVTSKIDGDLIKLWHVGTSTGEEPYSMAMIILDEIEKQGKKLELKIFATDVTSASLEIASRGIYSESIIADVTPLRLAKYFTKTKDQYQVRDSLRRAIIFSQHDILKNPPFNKMDLAVCRNLLIYYEAVAQKKIIGLLHYSLKLNGILLLGTSENLADHINVMKELDRKAKLFQNVKPATSIGMNPTPYLGRRSLPNPISKSRSKGKLDFKMGEFMNEAVAQELGLVGVFIDDNHNILEAIGEFKKFMELPEKGFSTNILSMFPENISAKISTAIRKAIRSKERILYKAITFKKNTETISFNLLVDPFNRNQEKEKGCLLLFVPTEAKEIPESSTAQIIEQGTTNIDDSRLNELEEELQETKQTLRTVVEEIETSNEELQATNEELLATNEELQSTNEELQSVNEELHTVNSELQDKNQDLASLNDDMDNLFSSTGIGTIFLDRHMNIRKFTPAVVEHFNLRHTDINRPIDHFSNKFSSEDNMLEEVKQVLETGIEIQQELQSFRGDWFLKRTTPYENSAKEIDGVVISFVNINVQKNAQQEFYYKNKAFEQLLEGNMAGFWDRMIQENTEYLSPSLKEMFGYKDHEMENIPEAWRKIVHPDDLQEVFDVYQKHVDSKGKTPYVFTLRHYHKDGSIVWIYRRGKIIEWDQNGLPVRMVGCNVDITPIKKIEQDLYRSNRELEQFAYVASHDLQEPLNTITNFMNLLSTEYGDKLDEEGHLYIDFISQAAGRMGNLVESVLGFSRIGQSSEIVTIDCNKVIQDIQVDLNKKITDTNTIFDIEKLPKIKGYHIEINSLLLNLITNSIKFRRKNVAPKIEIKAIKQDGFWKFTFKDNGIGIGAKNYDKVFNIFQKLNNMDSYSGTGIGLAQCKKIVELHDGKIWIDSAVGEGTTFHFTLKIIK